MNKMGQQVKPMGQAGQRKETGLSAVPVKTGRMVTLPIFSLYCVILLLELPGPQWTP